MSETKDVLILAIESSCDETAAAVVKNGREVLSNVISSQIALHTLYGGVVPEIASRKHIEKINQVIEEALKEAEVTLDDIDAIGVTYGPGLVGALLVGVAEAKAIAYAAGKPLVGVHHIEGHIAANFIEHKELEPPFFSLVVSGGHTHLVRVKDYGKFDIIGRTRDDAAGEAFDKVARAIGLGYPGGPKIDKVAKEGNPDAIAFPRANVEDAPYDFSFSGLKSAVLNYINGCKMKGEEYNQADIAASFQKAVTDVLVAKAMHAVEEYKVDKFAIAGGVASNSALRAAMKEACEKRGVKFYYPSPFLREMNDIDILIHGDFMEQAAVELEAMGYVLQQKIKHHDIYRKAPGIVVEAHRAMYDRTVDERQYAYFSDLSRAVRRKGFLYVYDFEAEDFYIYMMAHMAKHFYKRGCGIRNLVDIYVFLEKFGGEMNADYLQKQFAGLGLTAFTEHMEKLARIWLQGEPGEAFYQQLFDYMQGCGIYGKDENGIWNRFCDAQPEKGEKGRDALKRWYWFPPYEYMVLYYPWLSRNPVAGKFLLPAAWGIRAVRGVVCGRGKYKREMLRQIDASQIGVRQDIYRRLQLRFH